MNATSRFAQTVIPYATAAMAERYGLPRTGQNGGNPRCFVVSAVGGWYAVEQHGPVSAPERVEVFGTCGTRRSLTGREAQTWANA